MDYSTDLLYYPTSELDIAVTSIINNPPSDFAGGSCSAPYQLVWPLVFHRDSDGCPDYWEYDGASCTIAREYVGTATYSMTCSITVTPSTTTWMDGGTTTISDLAAESTTGGTDYVTITVQETDEVTKTRTETPDATTESVTSTVTDSDLYRRAPNAVRQPSQDIGISPIKGLHNLFRRDCDYSCYGDILWCCDYSQWCVGTNVLNTYCCTADNPVNCVGLEDPATVSPGVIGYDFATEIDWLVDTYYSYETAHVPSTTISYDETSTLTSTETTTKTEYETVTADRPTVLVTVYETTTVESSTSSEDSSSATSTTSTLGNESDGSSNQGTTSGGNANGGGLTSNVAGTTSPSFPSQPSTGSRLNEPLLSSKMLFTMLMMVLAYLS